MKRTILIAAGVAALFAACFFLPSDSRADFRPGTELVWLYSAPTENACDLPSGVGRVPGLKRDGTVIGAQAACGTASRPPSGWLAGTHTMSYTVILSRCVDVDAAGVRKARTKVYKNGIFQYDAWWPTGNAASQTICAMEGDSFSQIAMVCFDATNDDTVNISDIAATVEGFGALDGEPAFDLLADFNEDLAGTIWDVYAAVRQFGLVCTDF